MAELTGEMLEPGRANAAEAGGANVEIRETYAVRDQAVSAIVRAREPA